jgi:hypothetical protein
VIPPLFGLALVLVTVIVSGPAAAGQTLDFVAASTVTGMDDSETEDAYAKGVVEIDLNDPAGIGGSGAEYADGVVTIEAAGVYSLTGSLGGGQIVVDTKGKVYLELNGVKITSDSGPALSVLNSKKVTLVLAEGTINSLTGGRIGDADSAALFSNDTLVLTGSGVLNVIGSGGDGVRGDDDIVINSGTISVTAADDGIAANDDITVNGGDVTVAAQGDGLDSNGTVHVNGGALVSFGGTAQGEGGVDARGLVTITGGTVVAGGNALAALSDDCRQTSVYVTSGSIQPAGTVVRLVRDGQDVLTFAPDVQYQNVLISSDDLSTGVTYQAFLGETAGTLVVAAR